jgi:hypothetical protein
MARRTRQRRKKLPEPKPVPPKKTPGAKKSPPNTSGDPKGYNAKLFPNHRSVRRALRRLGYKVNLANVKTPSGIVRRFQKGYNICSIKRHPAWGLLKIDGVAGVHTLNALEIALNFSLKHAAKQGTVAHKFWQDLCRKLRPKKKRKRGPVGKGRHFVELIGGGIGRLRRPGIDFRVRVQELARKGSLLFAKVTIPSQAAHPGDKTPRWYPAIARPGHSPGHSPRPMRPAPGPRPLPAPGQ